MCFCHLRHSLSSSPTARAHVTDASTAPALPTAAADPTCSGAHPCSLTNTLRPTDLKKKCIILQLVP